MKYKPIFSYNEDLNKNAYMNWRIDKHTKYSTNQNIISIADGYSKATIILCKNCLENNNNKDADIIIFPILFSANHTIELYLKSIVYSINRLNGKKNKKINTHDIIYLYEIAKENIINFSINNPSEMHRTDEAKKLLDNLESYINETRQLMNEHYKNKISMDFSRYPTTTSNKPHFYVSSLKDDFFYNVVIDLENLNARLEEIFYNLRCFATHYNYLLEASE